MADNFNSGTAYVHIDGKNYALSGGLTYRCAGNSAEPQIGQDGYHGNKLKPLPGQIKYKGRNSSELSIAALNALSNVTVTLELANGKTVVGRNMSKTGDPIEVETEEGEFDMELTGPDVKEV